MVSRSLARNNGQLLLGIMTRDTTLGVTQGDIQRELATLRHMEKVRATMKDGIKVFCLW